MFKSPFISDPAGPAYSAGTNKAVIDHIRARAGYPIGAQAKAPATHAIASDSARVRQVVDAMVKDGQIGPDERQHYEAMALPDAEAARRLLHLPGLPRTETANVNPALVASIRARMGYPVSEQAQPRVLAHPSPSQAPTQAQVNPDLIRHIRAKAGYAA